MKKLVTLLIIVAFAAYSCGPSLDSENESWKRNLAAGEKLKSELPVFKPYIDLKMTEANKLWEEATKISDEKEKLKKMVEANNVFEQGTLANLSNMKSKIADLKLKKESLMKLKSPDEQMESRAQAAFTTVEDALKKADKVLYMVAEDFNIDEVPGKIDRAWTGLVDAYKEVEIIIENINKETDAIAKEKEKKEQEIKDEKQKAEDAVKDIKCPYCGTMNTHDYSKCSSCGAPKEEKK
jgi:hypothetical protein